MINHSSLPNPQPIGNNANAQPLPLNYPLFVMVPEPSAPGLAWGVSNFFPVEDLLFRTNMYANPAIANDFMLTHGGVCMDTHRTVDIPFDRRFCVQMGRATRP